jgi:hypothetical protein
MDEINKEGIHVSTIPVRNDEVDSKPVDETLKGFYSTRIDMNRNREEVCLLFLNDIFVSRPILGAKIFLSVPGALRLREMLNVQLSEYEAPKDAEEKDEARMG